jgi:alpha-amylase/alpha-mannosidase (GH57 family)
MRHYVRTSMKLPIAAVLALALCAVCAPALAGDLYLNLIWHQHQPLYLDPQTDQLRGPWVRTHGTKDYFDMAAMHRNFPEVHATINLTSSLLMQLQTYYVDRISPFLYVHEDGKWAVHADNFLADWKGKTDPWIDLALRPSASFDSSDIAKLLTEPWNAFGISAVQMSRFPEYAALRDKANTGALTADELTAVKAWFFLAHFDPDFLRGAAWLDIRSWRMSQKAGFSSSDTRENRRNASRLNVNLTDLLEERDGMFYLKRPLTERDANRLVADAVRVMEKIIPEHKALMYDPATHMGQLEIITTPFYHPILPLIIDSDAARTCQPRDSLPPRYAYPQDARAQVMKSMRYYTETFGNAPRGMWPAEGSISEAAADVFRESNVRWICGDMQVLQRSTPSNLPLAAPYRLHTDSGDVVLVFRETHLSDHIGFSYQNLDPDSAAKHFLNGVLAYKPAANEPDRLLTVILDGENAWEWYMQDMDGKRFLRNLYSALTEARTQLKVTCVTPTEYIEGNPQRSIPAHPVASLTAIKRLWPGSWINANFDTWIGEPEENKAWEYLLRTRRDLEASGLRQPKPTEPLPTDERALAAWHAYESVYAAEGSDWFWWYGADQTAPGGDLPFEDAFFSHMYSVYDWMKKAGVNIERPVFEPILSSAKVRQQIGGGVMAQGVNPMTKVKFVCNAAQQTVSTAIYIAGNIPELGAWQPNTIVLFDDGTHGDSLAHDGHWSLELSIPIGTEVQYKYTNSGAPGVWVPSEEFPFHNRSFSVDAPTGGLMIRRDIFGQE